MYAVDVTADGCVLVSADSRGLLVATDPTTTTMLWSKQMDGKVYTLRIYNNVVFVPETGQSVCVLDVMTGDVLRRYPALSGQTRGLVAIPGKLPLFTSLSTRVSHCTTAPQHKVAMRETAQDIDAGTTAVWNKS